MQKNYWGAIKKNKKNRPLPDNLGRIARKIYHIRKTKTTRGGSERIVPKMVPSLYREIIAQILRETQIKNVKQSVTSRGRGESGES